MESVVSIVSGGCRLAEIKEAARRFIYVIATSAIGSNCSSGRAFGNNRAIRSALLLLSCKPYGLWLLSTSQVSYRSLPCCRCRDGCTCRGLAASGFMCLVLARLCDVSEECDVYQSGYSCGFSCDFGLYGAYNMSKGKMNTRPRPPINRFKTQEPTGYFEHQEERR